MPPSSRSCQLETLSGPAALQRLPRPFICISKQRKIAYTCHQCAVRCSEGVAGHTPTAVHLFRASLRCGSAGTDASKLWRCLVSLADVASDSEPIGTSRRMTTVYSGNIASDGEQTGISRRIAMSQVAMLSVLAATLPGFRATAAEGIPQALQGDVKAAVMQAFKKAADKGKVRRCNASDACHAAKTT